jgi:hypothetical protein
MVEKVKTTPPHVSIYINFMIVCLSLHSAAEDAKEEREPALFQLAGTNFCFT